MPYQESDDPAGGPVYVGSSPFAEEVAILERLTRFPGAVLIAEVDPFAEWWMAGAPHLLEPVRAGDGKVVLLQFDEGGCGIAIVASDLETEAIGIVFDRAIEGHHDRLCDKEEPAEEQDQQGKRGDIGE